MVDERNMQPQGRGGPTRPSYNPDEGYVEDEIADDLPVMEDDGEGTLF